MAEKVGVVAFIHLYWLQSLRTVRVVYLSKNNLTEQAPEDVNNIQAQVLKRSGARAGVGEGGEGHNPCPSETAKVKVIKKAEIVILRE